MEGRRAPPTERRPPPGRPPIGRANAGIDLDADGSHPASREQTKEHVALAAVDREQVGPDPARHRARARSFDLAARGQALETGDRRPGQRRVGHERLDGDRLPCAIDGPRLRSRPSRGRRGKAAEQVLPEARRTHAHALSAILIFPRAPPTDRFSLMNESPTQLSPEVRTAASNAMKLGLSLVATWGVALVVRLLLPRYLGPDGFGVYTFAENFAAMAVGFLSFGVDPYIQKEIPVRPHHASDFFGGLALLRFALAALILAAMQVILTWSGRSTEAHHLVLIFGVSYAFVNLNNSLSALLQAHGTVTELATINVLVKLAWGAAVFLGIFWRLPMEALAVAFLGGEVLRSAALVVLNRRHLGLRLHSDMRAAARVIRASLPYYANSVTIALGSRLDTTVLAFLVDDDHEIGYYGSAANLAGLAFLLAPLMHSVLLPLLSRTHARSIEDFWRVLNRAAQGLIVVGTPIVIMLTLDAETWVELAFGPEFLPAARSLRMLAPQFVLTYLTVLYSMALIVQGDGWRSSSISLAGALAGPLLMIGLVPWTNRLGPGGAGLGGGIASIAHELLVLGLLLARLGRPAFDSQVRSTALRTLGAALGAAAIHVLLAPLGPWRLAVDLIAYLALALAFGALPRVLWAFAREATRRGEDVRNP